MNEETAVGDIQKQVQAALDRRVESGAERGLQVAVYRHGELLVDAVAGVADPATGRPVTPGTVFYNYSIGKAATATVVHVLVERGLFGYDTPVAELWPEFAARGKEAVTVRQVLNHTAGVPGLPLDTTVDDICDWTWICATIADSELWWKPGTAMGYHAYTFGYILGEIARRATGKRISQVLAEEVTGPLGVADELYFGMPVAEHGRLAVLEDQEGAADMMAQMPQDLPMFKAGPMSLFPTASLGNRTDVLAADIPAGAKTSARAIARMYAALLGGLPGTQLISPERLREATAVSFGGPDQVFGNDATWGLGFSLGLPGAEEKRAGVFGMAGAGGSYAYGDTATGIACAVTKNRLTMDFDAMMEVVALVDEEVAAG
ncbi:serine hydrolase domain-containing protein [Streptomyces sp. NPDC004609]|uniref:serine hydrolase domain-containing protein n=1 Tax=Streptomyces sp. NPDC004609 TaxID=3364704 RepID=UPI0036C938D9